MILTRNDVKLFYSESGNGNPPLLLIHGWSCDHTSFAPQIEYFRQRHRVVAVDLRGHGQSDKPQQDYTMPAFADDLAWMCQQLSLTKPVVIGHSIGGIIALELAARFPELPRAVMTLDSPVVAPQALLDSLAPAIQGLHTPAFRDVQKQIADMLFLPTDSPECKARIVAGMEVVPQHVAASAFQHAFYDTGAIVAAVKVPLLVLSAAQPFSDLSRLRALSPSVTTGQTVGAGHFHQLEVPAQVNDMITRFLAVALA